ncbi:hypothetical protein H0H81_001014 [Sphagnurus paluster]|uniref:Uncharacterized protein n=1 Tax=Sphagnurus paluster TaxID=117069 RepID=A0A9P7FZT0_9AGAR|nr:hypothetical protein H0H81_001014 [Sphagnurus paluster]
MSPKTSVYILRLASKMRGLQAQTRLSTFLLDARPSTEPARTDELYKYKETCVHPFDPFKLVLDRQYRALSFPSWFFNAAAQVYEPPSIYKRSECFKLKAGGKKVTILVQDDYDYAHFSATVGTNIEVKVRGRVPIMKMSIVSSRFDYDNKPKLHKNKIIWSIKDHSKYFILKIEGLRELVIAVDPLEISTPTSTGVNVFNVASGTYKADKSGQRLTTHAFHAAIADATQSKRINPRPIVYVPAGVYLVGNIVLPSKTSLYLAPGAVLRFTGKLEDYTTHWTKDGEGRTGTYWISTAPNSTDVRIFGRGTIDGNAYAYKEAHFAPSNVVAALTRNFVFDGPILRESGSTALNVVRSSGVDIRNLKVFNRMKDMMDNGSVDIVESENVTVSDAIAISLSDAFTTKASKPTSADVPAWPGTLQNSVDIIFKNCLAWTTNYGFKVGQGSVTDQRNIKFLSSTVYDAAVGMGIHKKWGSGSATNVTFEDMIIRSTTYTTSYLNGIVGAWLALFIEDAKAGVGPINDVHISNVMVLGDGGSAPLVAGVQGASVSNVTFYNVWLPKAKHPAASLAELKLGDIQFGANITVVATGGGMVSGDVGSSEDVTPGLNIEQQEEWIDAAQTRIVDSE